MPHPLQQQIAALRRRLRRLLAVYGLSHSLAIAIAVLVVAGCGDYLLRFQDLGIRLMCSGFALATSLWGLYAYLWRQLRVPLRDVELADRVQRCFPAFDDRLASAMEFLGPACTDPAAGSAALRRAVIAETATLAQPLDFRRALDSRPAVRGLALLLVMCLEALLLVAINPLVCRTAMIRLALPWGATAWPQAHHLTYRKRVEQVARGQTFEVEVVDARGGSLPTEVLIEYRFEGPGGSVTHERQTMRYLGGAMVARRENVTRPFAYRVEGGDDTTQPWIDLAVVEPPAVETLSVRLVPPAYTGWPASESPREIRALLGTRVEFQGRSSQPLTGGELHWGEGRIAPLVLADEFTFAAPAADAAPLVVEKSGTYWFALHDRQGLTSADNDRWEIRAVPDSPPSASIEQPAANVYITPSGTAPLRVSAKDDLAIRTMRLIFSRSASASPAEQTLATPLYAGPEQPPTQPGLNAATGNPWGEHRAVDYRWNLTGLGLEPGETVTFWAVAADYHGQQGRSEPRRLNVITAEELLQRIAARQTLILAELTRVLKMQRESRSQVAALAIRVAEVGRLEQLDLDHLQAAALSQRQVARTLTSRGDGVTMHVLSVMADLENNQLDHPDLRRRMDWLLAELGRVEQEILLPLDQELTAAVKSAQAPPDTPAPGKPAADPLLSRSLAVAGAAQDQVITALETLLTQLGQWDHYRRFHREMTQLGRDEEELAQRTTILARETLGRELGDLAPQQSAEIRTRAREQLDLALRLEHLLDQMREAAGPLAQRDPLAAETLTDAFDEAQRQALAGEMRQVRDQLEANRMGQALPGQKRIVQALRELAEILAGRRQQELARLAKKLDAAQQELDTLASREGALAGQFAAASATEQLRTLATPQAALAETARGLASRLTRLLAQRAGQTTEAAAQRMHAAGQAAEQASAADAQRQAQEALRMLTEAQEQLRRRRLQVGGELLAEQAARLEDAARRWYTSQQSLFETTAAVQSRRPTAEPLSNAQQQEIANLAQRQRGLSEETAHAAEGFEGAVYRLALGGAAENMRRAATGLAAQETGPVTQAAQRQALARLAMLMKCFETDKPEGQGGATGGQGGKQGAPSGGTLAAAEIKLVKLLQESLNARAQELGKDDAQKESARAEYRTLGEEQGRLAALLLEMLREPKEEPKSSGEKR